MFISNKDHPKMNYEPKSATINPMLQKSDNRSLVKKNLNSILKVSHSLFTSTSILIAILTQEVKIKPVIHMKRMKEQHILQKSP